MPSPRNIAATHDHQNTSIALSPDPQHSQNTSAVVNTMHNDASDTDIQLFWDVRSWKATQWLLAAAALDVVFWTGYRLLHDFDTPGKDIIDEPIEIVNPCPQVDPTLPSPLPYNQPLLSPTNSSSENRAQLLVPLTEEEKNASLDEASDSEASQSSLVFTDTPAHLDYIFDDKLLPLSEQEALLKAMDEPLTDDAETASASTASTASHTLSDNATSKNDEESYSCSSFDPSETDDEPDYVHVHHELNSAQCTKNMVAMLAKKPTG